MERYKHLLETGRRDFLEACHSAGQARPGSWTPFEIIEHVVILEDRYLSWLAEGDGDAPPREPDNEMRLFLMIRNRQQPRQAADALWPAGRFRTMEEALAAFNDARDRAVAMADESLYSVGVTHPFFGRINGAELLQLIDGHARRHAEQLLDCDR